MIADAEQKVGGRHLPPPTPGVPPSAAGMSRNGATGRAVSPPAAGDVVPPRARRDCEADDWPDSEACRFSDALRQALCHVISDTAVRGWDDWDLPASPGEGT